MLTVLRPKSQITIPSTIISSLGLKEGDQLDMRFYFSEMEVAQDFKNYISGLRNAIRNTKFHIGEVRIGSIGERMLAS